MIPSTIGRNRTGFPGFWTRRSPAFEGVFIGGFIKSGENQTAHQIWVRFKVVFQCLTRGTGKFILRLF